MHKFLSSFLIFSCFMPLISCKGQQIDEYTYQERLDMVSAATADEWIQRLQKDLSSNTAREMSISRLYSELPPQEEWLKITTKLDEITKDNDTFKEFTEAENHHQWRSGGSMRLKLQLLSILLAENGKDAEPTFRSILLSNDHSSYSYGSDNELTKLLLLSKKPQDSIDWYKLNIQKNKSNHTHSKSTRPTWKKALAENRIDQGIQLLLKKIQASKIDDKNDLISSLAKISYLLDKPKLGEQAMTMFEKNIIEYKKSNSYFSSYAFSGSFNYLAQTGQWQRLHNICDKVKNTKSKKSQSSFSSFPNDNPLLHYQLTALYNLKKHDSFENEINAVIKKNNTNSRGIFNLLDENIPGSASVGSLFIDILTKKGDDKSKELAYKFCTHLLARNQGDDSYYKRAIALNSEEAAKFIASLREYDPFEERPLIWQAELALQAGDIESAEKLIQQAIALDPSDGDQGKYTRMHCYDVLARILAKQGNAEKAKFFNEVVISIREGEAADDYLYAGLIQEATDRYKKALGHFNDAYCLQSRLAKTLMEAGKFDEAIPHFKKAFELMPVSFGPRESHCFGCEGLFDDSRVRDLALPTLKAFLEKEPDNPRTPYLLGLLFEEMKKKPEAITAYKKAIELDPNYYNAASKLHDLLSEDPKNFDQLIELNKQLFEIAPYARKASYIPNPHLLKSYWKIAHNFPASPLKLSPVTELGLTVKELSETQFKETSGNGVYYSSYGNEEALDGWSARELLMSNEFLK